MTESLKSRLLSKRPGICSLRGGRIVMLGVAVLLGYLLLGCTSRQESIDGGVIRFIDEEQQLLFGPDRVSRLEVLREMSFEAGELPPECKLIQGRAKEARATATRLLPESSAIVIRCQVGHGAQSADLVRARLDGLRRGGSSLRWRTTTGSFEDSEQVDLDRWQRADGAQESLIFEVGRHRQWDGEISELELRLRPSIGDLVELRSLTIERREVDATRLADSLEKPWKVEIDHEWRNSLLALPSTHHERKLIVPRGAELRLSYGLMKGVVERLQFIAEVHDGNHRVLVLDRELVGSAPGEAARWHDVAIDLAAWEGQEIEVRLAVETEGELDPRVGLAVWGNPEVRARHSTQRPNIVVISVDTLRAENLSLYGYERSTSAQLAGWAAERGVVFRNAVAPAPWTLPSHVSIFSGLEAFVHGINFNDSSATELTAPMLAELLRSSGYSTYAVTGGGFVHPRFGFARGFDAYRFWPSIQPRSDELADHLELVEFLLKSNRIGKPLFLFFHTFEVHPPNQARQPFFSGFSNLDPKLRVETSIVRPKKQEGFLGHHQGFLVRDGERQPLPTELQQLPIDLYDSAIAYADSMLDNLFQSLNQRGLLDETLVVVTSDHGEALGEHDRWGHGHLYENNLMVPLILFFPRRQFAGRAVDRQVRLVDLLPTILEVADLPAANGINGKSLLGLLSQATIDYRDEAFSYAASTNEGLSLRSANRYKYLFRDAAWPPLNSEEALFDLSADEDTLENIAESASNSASVLRRQAVKALQTRSRGLHLRIDNATSTQVHGRLESSLIHPVTVKSAGDERATVMWKGMGRLAFDLESHDELTLMFISVSEENLTISGQIEFPPCAAAASFQLELSLPEQTSPRKFEVEPEECHAGTGDSAREMVTLTARWVGPILGAGPPSDGPDPVLMQQLDALGYLD